MSYSYGSVKDNRFVLEGAYFNFDNILPILNKYGIEKLKERFILIGLVQNDKSVDEFVSDFKKYDTEDDWTYNFSDDDLRDVAQDAVSFSAKMTEHLTKHGFTLYDTSRNREQVFRQIVDDIKSANNL